MKETNRHGDPAFIIDRAEAIDILEIDSGFVPDKVGITFLLCDGVVLWGEYELDHWYHVVDNTRADWFMTDRANGRRPIIRTDEQDQLPGASCACHPRSES
jgi:hypothetical protein